LADRQAKEIMAGYDQGYITEKLAYVTKQAGQINDLGAYTYDHDFNNVHLLGMALQRMGRGK